MPRRRQTDLHLPPRVYRHGAGYRWMPKGGKPVNLGRDLGEALKKYATLIQGEQLTGGEKDTVGWLIKWYITNIKIVAPENSERTIEDKKTDAEHIIKEMGHIPFRLLRPFHVREYLDLGIKQDRAVRTNRERALLSHACTIAIGKGWLDVNPCFGVVRNHEDKRDRYVTDAEMNAVLPKCNVQVRALATLIYRTLQRPSDILSWTASNIVIRDGQRVLRFIQGKTGAKLDIAISHEIDAAFDALKADRREVIGMTLIHNRKAHAYTEDGIRSMWTRARVEAKVKDFGLYDLKAKGATDMYRDGVSIEKISALCGHESVTTTETYIKARLTEIIAPNQRKIQA